MQDIRNIHIMHAKPLVSAGLASLLDFPDWEVTTQTAQPRARDYAALLVADYDTAMELARTMPARRFRQPILVVSARDKEWEVRRALEAPVQGYLLEDASAAQLREAARAVLAGTRYLCPRIGAYGREAWRADRLTGRESEVLRLLALGHCNKRIARDLGIGVGTVKSHVRGVMTKLGASARTQAVVMAAQRGLVGIGSLAPG